MYKINNKNSLFICTSLLLSVSISQQVHADVNATLWGIYSNQIMFIPQPVENAYLELEYYGQKGAVDLYGYIDAPKYFGGNDNIKGVWDKTGSKLFMEHQPKLSLNRLLDKDLSLGIFKDWFVATDWIVDIGGHSANSQNTLYYGLGTSIDTKTKLGMNVNVYAKQQWENYGASNANTSDDGGRLQVQFFYPLYSFKNGAALNYFTFTNYDFASHLADKDAQRSNEALVSTHIFSYNMKHLRLFTAARYFHNGGQFKDGETANWGAGDFTQKSTGWGYYIAAGYQF